MIIRYTLPYPPTTNNLFLNTKNGRVKTGGYRLWRHDAGMEIIAQGRKKIAGKVSISIAVTKPDARRRDISNLIKAVEDLLVSMEVIEDDHLVQRISIAWVEGEPFECAVIIQAYEQELAA